MEEQQDAKSEIQLWILFGILFYNTQKPATEIQIYMYMYVPISPNRIQLSHFAPNCTRCCHFTESPPW